MIEKFPTHPVLEEIQRRQRGEEPQLKLALAIEGGGIRGAVTAGMVCSLASSDVEPSLFDAHFGSSAGSYVAAYYLSGRVRSGATMFYEDNRGGEFIDLRQIFLRKRPVLSLDHVLGPVMEERKPIDFQEIIDSRRLHILATRLSDLTRHVFPPPTSVQELKDQLRAGATIPAVAGEPVEIDGEYYIDAGLTEPMPYKAAIDKGFDAVLLLSSRPEHEAMPGRNDPVRKLVTFALSRQIKIKRKEILEMISSRALVDTERLTELREKSANPIEPPFVLAIHPSSEAPLVKQLEKKSGRIIAGTIAGYLAVKEVFGGPAPSSFNTTKEFFGHY